MKYLILFLLLMFSCNVNADVSLFEFYQSLSDIKYQVLMYKKSYIKMYNYSDDFM